MEWNISPLQDLRGRQGHYRRLKAGEQHRAGGVQRHRDASHSARLGGGGEVEHVDAGLLQVSLSPRQPRLPAASEDLVRPTSAGADSDRPQRRGPPVPDWRAAQEPLQQTLPAAGQEVSLTRILKTFHFH